MSSTSISTSALLERLFKTGNVVRFIRHFDREMKQTSLCEYLACLCVEKSVIPEHVINRAGIERTYGHQIFNGRRKPSRDKTLQLALGFGLTFAETQELLRVAHRNPLYPKIKRDVIVIFALENGLCIDDVQATLWELSLPGLGKEERDG